MASGISPDEQAQHQQAQYYDGLHVVPQQLSSSFPEVVPDGYDNPNHYNYPVHGDHGQWSQKEVGNQYAATEATTPTPRPWWRRKSVLLALLAGILILAISLGAGLGAGLKKGKGQDHNEEDNKHDNSGTDNDTNKDNDKHSVPKCNGGLCDQIISATVHADNLLVFAQTTDDTIAYRNYSNSWADWHDLGKMEDGFSSQPTIQSWKVNDKIPRLDVLATAGDPGTLYGTWFSEAEGWAREEGKWKSMWSGTQKPVSSCVRPSVGLHLWMSQDDHICFNKWEQRNKDDLSDEANDGVTAENGDFKEGDTSWIEVEGSSTAESTVAVVCSDQPYQVNLIYFDTSNDQVTRQFYVEYKGFGWDSDTLEGRKPSELIGDPVAFSLDESVVQSFMVSRDNSLHTYSSDFSDLSLKSLQGSLLSQPAVISLGTNSLDIVALGTNGRLQHLQTDYNGQSDWEDLGLWAHSAPTMIYHKSQIFLFAVSESGELQSWSRDVSINKTWKGSLKYENLGGKLSTEYFTTRS